MLRNKPMLWDEQKTPGTYPVWGVSWFEARAYARWLNSKLAPKLSSAVGVEYAVMLPTELQWERSARATSLIQADSRNSPWGNEEFNAEKHANLHQAIGSVCTVGLFPPNPVGLQDMAGNTWEWMDNLYTEKPETFQRVDRNHPLASANSLEKSDQPSLRGGSWIDRVGSARCSYRGRDHPGYWDLNIGFRVVLSLPD